MKVALLLYGQPRNIDNMKVIESHKNLIINKYDADVFCHTDYSDAGTYTINPYLKQEPIKCDKKYLGPFFLKLLKLKIPLNLPCDGKNLK